ncbi:hypothetical protein RJ639_013741 [Escallonia herrerae]|uniref:Pre-mRNA-processing factor 39 n=1 Tax=Escallonia herrerae TaxID=1293975 RepID=A0AA89APL5_9ASTE|nr:hypothetical protein RJ639_013741 [Escallonia herrerae]
MGDSEMVVAQTSAVISYTSVGYSSTDYATGSSEGLAVPAAGSGGEMDATAAPTTSGDLAPSTVMTDAANAMRHASNVGVGNTYNIDLNAEAEAPTTTSQDISIQKASTTTSHDTSIQEPPTTGTHDAIENIANSANGAVGASQVAAYEASLNGNPDNAAGTIELAGSNNGITANHVHGSASEHQLLDVSALSAEEERLWNIVRANSLEFSAWTALIEETERVAEWRGSKVAKMMSSGMEKYKGMLGALQLTDFVSSLSNVLKIRRIYDAFLAEFPLCYGYWKKYADHEARLGSVDKVVEVYERAVQGVTYSVDMWLHYCVFAISTYGDPDTIRRLFERGLAYVGTDYLSFPLWDKYIEYEFSQQEWSRLAMIYTQILENPNQQLDRYFNSFRELVASRPLSELRTAEEVTALAGAQDLEGEVHPNSVEQSPKPVSAGLTEAEELEKYMAIREELYKKAKEFDSKIIGFETAIRRPYFHVRPLSVAELENWHNFLNFIEGEGDLNKVVKLYERCLIACANYPEYWIRYVLFMEASGSMDLAENALARASQVFVKRQPEIHLFAARFREHNGDVPGARAAYQLVHTEISPGLLEAIIKHANMEHRLGNLDDACSLYEQAIAIEKGKEHSQTLPRLFAQYSRFLFLVTGKIEKAREILDQMLENNQLSKPLLEALIHLESVQWLPKRIEYLDSLVEKFISPSPDNANAASIIEKEDLSSIFLEFLDYFGDPKSIKKADNRHAKLFLHHKSASESRKRHAEDALVSERARLARTGGVSSAPSVMGAYPTAQNQWTVQPQAWPQAAQAQGQQWNSGYTQQAAYGTYGSYGTSYTQPSVQASVPQTVAYGAYPPAYSAQQAFPQQGQAYVQPSAAAAVTPGQQPTAVPQTYYGSYY